MSVKKFKFVSPGVFLREIDKSQIPKEPGGVGPVIIGRAARGPALKPVKVESYQEFTEIFGEAISGQPSGRIDTWRKGAGHQAATYGPYAAQAYLKAKINSPVTFIRLLGVAGDDAEDTTPATPGWEAEHAFGIWGTKVIDNTQAENHADLYQNPMKATLLGIIYATDATFKVGVNGTEPGADAQQAGPNNLFDAADGCQPVLVDANNNITILLNKGGTTIPSTVSFKKNRGGAASKFIREVLNTDPTLTNDQLVSGLDDISKLGGYYWLGETFEENYVRLETSTAGAGEEIAIFVTKLNASMKDRSDASYELSSATSPWVIHQLTDAGEFSEEDFTKLFRIHTIQEGEEANDFLAEIQRIRVASPSAISPFGTFDIAVKKVAGDQIVTVDMYENLNLNPNSANYVAKRIGDQYFAWDSTQKRNRVHGNYENQSPYIRIEMGPALEARPPSNPRWVPFGFLGAVEPKDQTIPPGSVDTRIVTGSDDASWAINAVAGEGVRVPSGRSLKFAWPEQQLVQTGSINNRHPEGKKFVFGTSFYSSAVGDAGVQDFGSIADEYKDFSKKLANFTNFVANQKAGTTSATTQRSQIFTLNEIVINDTSADSIPGADINPGEIEIIKYVSGSYNNADNNDDVNDSYTSLSVGSERELLTVVDSFRVPFHGGCDGVDITERDPFNARVVDDSATTSNNYAYASIDRAIELMRDAEMLECNLACMPGITNENLTSKLIQTCEARGDALAIIDLPDVYRPVHQNYYADVSQRKSLTVKAAARALENRRINSSYGCTYYPWVQIADTETGARPWVPPSVVALGVMAYTEQRDQVWFAPAGFNRGGLNEGNAGLPVLQASERLLSSQRDTLYEANINPIASFVSEGLVIFGQKTLQTTRSALDRINVRRLLIFVKKEVSRISNRLLFDNNLPATWNRFKGQVVPFLEEVKTKLGLQDFKVVLDGTTTTPDLIDRNIMYAKIFLKPARAIEFIAVDFVITRTGAEFDD